MTNPITSALAARLNEEVKPGSGVTYAKALALVLVRAAIDGDVTAARLIVDAVETYDEALDPSWCDEEDD